MNNPDINETLDAGMRDFALRMGDRQQQRNNAVAAATPPYQAPTRSMVEQRESSLLPTPVDSATVPPQETTSDGVLTTGAFYGLYEDSSGDTYLLCGAVSAGEGTYDPDDILVLESGALPSGITAGDRLYLDVDVDAITDDDNEILIPGIEITGGSVEDGTTVPDNVFPGVSTAGHVYLELGRWSDAAFHPSGAGSFLIAGCNGNFTISRY